MIGGQKMSLDLKENIRELALKLEQLRGYL